MEELDYYSLEVVNLVTPFLWMPQRHFLTGYPEAMDCYGFQKLEVSKGDER